MAVHRFPTAPAPSGTPSDTLAERMERLRRDAESVAAEHTDVLLQTLVDATTLAEQVAAGGEAYPVGVREIARRSQHDLHAMVMSLRVIQGRAH